MSTKSYYLYKKQLSYDGTSWIDVQPNEYSVSGDTNDPMTPVVKEEHDPACGAMPPIYQWVDTQDTMCVGYDKYVVQKRQVSYDNGLTWEDVTPSETRAGSLIEAYSEDCGYYPPIYEWRTMDISTNYVCVGTSKYYKEQKYVSYDNGETWEGMNEYRTGTLYEVNSIDCGYVPTTIYRWVDTQDTICVYEDEHDYSQDYFTFVAEADNMSVSLSYANSNVYQYSVDGGQTWSNLANNGSTTSVNSGQTIMFKASGLTVSSNDGIGTLNPSVFASVQGNIMSLVSGDTFATATEVASYAFLGLFFGCTGLTSAENLILPATTLASRCYMSMFRDCTNLTVAPELPAETLTSQCYQYMFRGCTSLNSITCLATDISASNCTYFWVSGVAASGTFTKAASMSSWTTGASGIPNNWTIQNA